MQAKQCYQRMSKSDAQGQVLKAVQCRHLRGKKEEVMRIRDTLIKLIHFVVEPKPLQNLAKLVLKKLSWTLSNSVQWGKTTQNCTNLMA